MACRPHQVVILALLALGLCLPLGDVFANGDFKSLRKDLKHALADGDVTAAISVLDEVAEIGGLEAQEELYQIGLKYGTTEDFYNAVIAHLHSTDDVVTFVRGKFEKAKSEQRVYSCEILVGIDSADAVLALVDFMGDSNAYVKQAAIIGLERSQRREGIGALIDLLEDLTKKRKKDVLYYMVRDALYNLANEDYDLIDDWRNWWETRKDSFDPKATEGGKTGVKRTRRDKSTDFFGVPIESKNICFVIDTSDSMKWVQKNDIPGMGKGDGSDSGGASGGGDMTPDDKILAAFWRRMEMAKRELHKVLVQMSSDTTFNIVSFSTKATLFRKKSVKASSGNKKKAQKFNKDLKHEGHTHTLDALIKAFNADKKTNTIFFLSDGLPMKDGLNLDPTGPILDKVFEMNRFRKIKIHTFGFYPRGQKGGKWPNLELANQWLKELAKRTGGKFTAMEVDTDCTPNDPYGLKKKKKKSRKKKKKKKDST